MMAMRNIGVSTDVFAAIWADRQSGEETEEQILRRKFGVNPKPAIPTRTTQQIGFRDPRFNIELPEGFEIYRTYLGVEYKAKAVNGAWLLLSTGDSYPSLNQLSKAIGAKVENAWQNWYFTGDDGKRQLVTALRR